MLVGCHLKEILQSTSELFVRTINAEGRQFSSKSTLLVVAKGRESNSEFALHVPSLSLKAFHCSLGGVFVTV